MYIYLAWSLSTVWCCKNSHTHCFCTNKVFVNSKTQDNVLILVVLSNGYVSASMQASPWHGHSAGQMSAASHTCMLVG